MGTPNIIWDTLAANCKIIDQNNARRGKEIKTLKAKESNLTEHELSDLIVQYCDWFVKEHGSAPTPAQVIQNWDNFRAVLPLNSNNPCIPSFSQQRGTRREIFNQLFIAFGKPAGGQLTQYLTHLEWVSDDILNKAIKRAIQAYDWLPSIAIIGDIAYTFMHNIRDAVTIWKCIHTQKPLNPKERAIVDSYNLIAAGERGQSFTDFYAHELRRQKIKTLEKENINGTI
jgi:hypothetical protein